MQNKTVGEMAPEEFKSMVNTIIEDLKSQGLVKKTKYVRKKGPWK